MNNAQFLQNLFPPSEPVDVVLDTDAYNEVDDQFAIAYLVRSQEQLQVKGFCAAPFFVLPYLRNRISHLWTREAPQRYT